MVRAFTSAAVASIMHGPGDGTEDASATMIY
eukprot:SAG31_NODE_1944_length_6856_cov_3.850969_2_plen_31_part_00